MLTLLPMKRDGKYSRIPDIEDQEPASTLESEGLSASAFAEGTSRYDLKAQIQPPYFWSSTAFILCLMTILTMNKLENGKLGRLMSASIPFEQVEHPDPPTKFWKDLEGPLPTGAFWTNFVTDEGQAPVNLLPYGIKCLPEGIQTSYNPTRRVMTELVVSDPFDNDLELSAAEEYVDRKVAKYDSLSVTMQYKVSDEGTYTAHLVKGSPYVTVSYEGATPVIKAPNMQIISVEERNADGKRVGDLEPVPLPPGRRGVKRVLSESTGSAGSPQPAGVQYLLNLGNFQKWLVYVSDPNTALIWDKVGNTMTAQSPMESGFVRVAILPPLKDDMSVSRAFRFLMRHVGVYPTGASVSLSYSKDGSTGVMAYDFSTDGVDGPVLMRQPPPNLGGGLWGKWMSWVMARLQTAPTPALLPHVPLLMYALPHHIKSLEERDNAHPYPHFSGQPTLEAVEALPSMYCLKGRLTPIVGGSWKMRYALADVGWDYGIEHNMPKNQRNTITEQLIADISDTAKESAAADSYNFGKEVSRMAMLAGLADSLGVLDQRDAALKKVKRWLEPWLEGTNDDKFVYDKSYRGVVTNQGLADKMADFGLGWYNDHHFHFGYHIYAYAMASRFDRAFLRKHKAAMDSVVADICNPQRESTVTPYVRHKDFYDGHSWASGIFSMSNGKGQESSSEAVNAYYACYLYGSTTGDKELTQHSQFMLALEVEAVKLYWHMPNSEVYDSYFSSNVMVGNIGAFDVTCTTWFGSNLEYVHGIQIMPVTPATSLLFNAAFVEKEWPLLADRLPQSERGPSRDAFTAPGQPNKDKDKDEEKAVAVTASCQAHPQCAVLGLEGDCCPTPQGASLDCCGSGSERAVSNSFPNGGLIIVPSPEAHAPVSEEWRAIMFMDLAVIDKEEAFQNLLKLHNFGIGASKTNALMWSSSRASPASKAKPAYAAKHIAPRQCAKVSACDANGMLGDCCPNESGGNLACCPMVTGAQQA